jgi:hypothetical protein
MSSTNAAANDLDELRNGKVPPILWPPRYPSGDMYPCAMPKNGA